MNSLFTPHSSESDEIGRKLTSNEHFGKEGALVIAERLILPKAKAGNVPAMMQMSNVYYTLMGAVGVKGGLINKMRAVRFLYLAKLWATQAFLTDTKLLDLYAAIRMVDTRIQLNKESNLQHGDVHILMSCHAQWAKQIRRRLRINDTHERIVVKSCNLALKHSANEKLRALAACVMLDTFSTKESWESEDLLRRFFMKHFERVMRAEDISTVDLGLVQTVCRVARALSMYRNATELGQKYGLMDQVNKAKNRS